MTTKEEFAEKLNNRQYLNEITMLLGFLKVWI